MQESAALQLTQISGSHSSTATHCPYCAFQCGMYLRDPRESVKVTGNALFPVNKGGLCIKGWTAPETLAHPDRLLTPLARVMQYIESQRSNGGKLLVVDPRVSATAQAATLHLNLTPGSDAALANGLLHILIRDGLIDSDYIRERTEGFDKARSVAATYWPERVERLTGVPEAQLVEAAHMLGTASSAIRDGAHGARCRATEPGSKQYSSIYQSCSSTRAGRSSLQWLWYSDWPGQWTGGTRAWSESRSTPWLS